MSDRSVDELLGDLRRRLEAADAARRSRPRRVGPRRRGILLVAAVVLAVASTATATRSVWAPSAPDDRGEGGPVVQLAAGGAARTAWALAARRCADGSAATFLRVGAGGTGRGCDGRSRAVRSYYDPDARRTFVFALVATSARAVQLGLRGTPSASSVPTVTRLTVRPRAADPLALSRARLARTALAVGSVGGAWTVATMAVVDGAGRVIWRCEDARCGGG